ncbi:MAG: hypothetical protein M1838_003410 [Thelocarpon superellum]|nr:MAG: hypothetical protein M1838_003410 [Thelocarpon superellum]
MTACFGQMNSIGTFQAYISTHQLQDYSPSTTGWIFSLYVFLAFFCGVQIGPVFDARGPRGLILAGSVIGVTGMMLLGICSEYWHFIIVWGILGGTGAALIFTPAVASIGHFFLARRGVATGIATTGGSVGGIVFPLMLQGLIPKIGFAWSTRVMGLIILVLTLFANLLIRSRLPRVRGVSARPDFGIFAEPTFLLTTIGVFLIEWGLFIPLSYISSYALANGVSPAFSYQLLAIFNAGSFFGRAVPGWISDHLGRFNAMILTIALCLLTTLALWLPAGTSTALIVLYAVSFGFASGSNIRLVFDHVLWTKAQKKLTRSFSPPLSSLTSVCVGQLCKTENYGRYYATCYTIVSFGSLTGIPIAGQIISMDNGSYWGLIVFTGMCYAGGLVAFVAARAVAVGWSVRVVF